MSGWIFSARAMIQAAWVARKRLDSVASEDRLLPVQGHRIDVLAGDQMREQPRRRIAPWEDLRRQRRRLDALIAARTRILLAHVLQNLHLRRNVIELLSYIATGKAIAAHLPQVPVVHDVPEAEWLCACGVTLVL